MATTKVFGLPRVRYEFPHGQSEASARSIQVLPFYPDRFEHAEMDVPEAPNVKFSFVVKAPKEYVMDARHLTRAHGGNIQPLTAGSSSGEESWESITDDMERIIYVSGVGVTQVVGNLHTPEDGDWHFEWKAGAPYYKMPLPLSLIMKAVHGTATLSDGPGPDETTVTVENRQNPGIAVWFTRLAAKAATPTIPGAAPMRFTKREFVGPQKKA